MTSIRAFIERATLCACLLGVACVPGNGSGEPEGQRRESDELAIRAVLARNQDATNRRDAAGVAATFIANADIVFPDGRRVSGLEEIRRNEEEFYGTPGFIEWRTQAESIRFPNLDVAIVEAAGTTLYETGTVAGRATLVLARVDGEWKIAAVRVLPTPAP